MIVGCSGGSDSGSQEPRSTTAQDEQAKLLGKASPFEKNSLGMELVLIPPGKFIMGSPASEKDRSAAEAQVDVTLTKAFYLGKTEVTQGQWRALMGSTPWKGQAFVREGDNYPATFVDCQDAKAFCKKLSVKERATYRLPTEAEWEYACRAGTTTPYSFGEDATQLSDYAWWGAYFEGNTKSEKYAHEVGRKRPNPFGLHDMHGNVYEWCEDKFADQLPGGTDPLVSSGGPAWVNRGGGWGGTAALSRSAFRRMFAPPDRNCADGFRVARIADQ